MNPEPLTLEELRLILESIEETIDNLEARQSRRATIQSRLIKFRMLRQRLQETIASVPLTGGPQ